LLKPLTNLSKKAKLKKNRINCVAISGQTIRHEVSNTNPFSMQIGDPNIVSNNTGLTVISDFRNMHISLGGEGAPLVPEFIMNYSMKLENLK
jgi:anhydro-N-acetylmuramic acid kinase